MVLIIVLNVIPKNEEKIYIVFDIIQEKSNFFIIMYICICDFNQSHSRVKKKSLKINLQIIITLHKNVYFYLYIKHSRIIYLIITLMVCMYLIMSSVWNSKCK